MAIRNLHHHISLLALRSEVIYSLNQLQADPMTQAFVPVFEGARDDWGVVFAEELALRDAVSAVNARVVSADRTLKTLASRVSKVLFSLIDDDKTHPLYIAYFKKTTLSEFRRPVLGTLLDGMRGWISELKASDVPALSALGLEVEAAVDVADKVVTSRNELEAESTFFRETGNRKKLFDKVNAVRKQTHGELSVMPHEKLGVPARYADQFFRHDSSSEKPETLESIDEDLAALGKQIAEKNARRKVLEVEAEQAAQAVADRAAKQAEIANLEKIAAEAEQKSIEARAKIAALSG